MKIYLSGPMTGHENLNYPAFHSAAERLRSLGHEVFNPAETFGGATDRTWAEYMREDIAAVLSVEAVVVLDGWEHSRGATLEVAVARAIDVPVWNIAEVRA